MAKAQMMKANPEGGKLHQTLKGILKMEHFLQGYFLFKK